MNIEHSRKMEQETGINMSENLTPEKIMQDAATQIKAT